MQVNLSWKQTGWLISGGVDLINAPWSTTVWDKDKLLPKKSEWRDCSFARLGSFAIAWANLDLFGLI